MFDFLSQKFSSLFSHLTDAKKLTEENVQDAFVQVHDALLQADVPYNVVQSFIQSIKDEVVGQKIIASLLAEGRWQEALSAIQTWENLGKKSALLLNSKAL